MLCNLEESLFVCHCLLRIKVSLLFFWRGYQVLCSHCIQFQFYFKSDWQDWLHTLSFGSDESSPFVQTVQSMSSISTLVAIVMAQAKNNAKRLMYSSCQLEKEKGKLFMTFCHGIKLLRYIRQYKSHRQSCTLHIHAYFILCSKTHPFTLLTIHYIVPLSH